MTKTQVRITIVGALFSLVSHGYSLLGFPRKVDRRQTIFAYKKQGRSYDYNHTQLGNIKFGIDRCLV